LVRNPAQLRTVTDYEKSSPRLYEHGGRQSQQGVNILSDADGSSEYEHNGIVAPTETPPYTNVDRRFRSGYDPVAHNLDTRTVVETGSSIRQISEALDRDNVGNAILKTLD
jgi:hypothetical protein